MYCTEKELREQVKIALKNAPIMRRSMMLKIGKLVREVENHPKGFVVEIQERLTGKVLYIHNAKTGITVMRVCWLPNSFPDEAVDIIYQDKQDWMGTIEGFED